MLGRNSQSREQMHVILDKLDSSLRQNYYNFVCYVNTFFCYMEYDNYGFLVNKQNSKLKGL